MAPPPHAGRIRAFPGGATFNIVGPDHPGDVDGRASNNIENGTSAARDPIHLRYDARTRRAPPDEEDLLTVTERTIELEAGTFSARPYRAEDEQAVLDLWHVAFGKELDPELWRWKYVDNPFGMRVLVCRDPSGEIAVVMYSGVPYRARWKGGWWRSSS